MNLGFHVIDRLTGGVAPGQLVVVNGADGTGLDAFAASVLRHASLNDGLTVAYFTPSGREDEVRRLLAMMSGVNLSASSTGDFTANELERILGAARQLHQAGIWLDDAQDLKLHTIREKLERLKHHTELDAVVFSLVAEGDGFLEGLKRIAEDLDITVLAGMSGHSLFPPDGSLRETSTPAMFDSADHVLALSRTKTYQYTAEVTLALLKSPSGASGSTSIEYIQGRGVFVDRFPVASSTVAPALITTVNRELALRLSGSPGELVHASPRVFEQLMAEVFHAQGFEVELTAQTRDGGVDLIAVRRHWPGEEFRLLVECKRYRADRPVGVGVIRGLAFLLDKHHADRAILATTSRFSRAAVAEAEHPTLWRVSLKDFEAIRAWMRDYHDYLLLH